MLTENNLYSIAWMLNIDFNSNSFSLVIPIGQRTKIEEDLLQGQKVQKAHPSQGNPVQDRKSLPLCSGWVQNMDFVFIIFPL